MVGGCSPIWLVLICGFYLGDEALGEAPSAQALPQVSTRWHLGGMGLGFGCPHLSARPVVNLRQENGGVGDWTAVQYQWKIERTRAEPQWIEATRPLCHLQYSVSPSRLHGIYPNERVELP